MNIVKDKLLWEFQDNFDRYRKRNKEDIWEFHGLKKRRTGLPVNIFVDDGGSYKMRNHPLWVYFQNDYDDSWANKEFLPISVSNNPELLTSKRVKISSSDLQKVFNFIRINRTILKKLADDKMNQEDFWKEMDVNRIKLDESFDNSNLLLNEMATIKPNISGLPVTIWVDEGTSPQHGPRIKFQSVKNTNSRNFSSITIGDNPVTKNLPKNFSQRKDTTIDNDILKLLIAFVQHNKNILLKLAKDDNFEFERDFIPNMVKVDKNGNPINTPQQKQPQQSNLLKPNYQQNNTQDFVIDNSMNRVIERIHKKLIRIEEMETKNNLIKIT